MSAFTDELLVWGVAGVRGSPTWFKCGRWENLFSVYWSISQPYSVYVEFPTLPRAKISSVERLWILVSTAVAQTSSTLDFFCFYHGSEWAVATQRDEFLMSYMFLHVPERWLLASCASLSLWISGKLRGTDCSQSHEAHKRDSPHKSGAARFFL